MPLFHRRDEIDRVIEEELQFHIEMRAQAYVRSGMEPERALAAARDRFGNIEDVRVECQEIAMNFFDTLLQDLRYAVRMLRASPAFTAAALASLILGTGATATIFSVVNGVILRRLPFRDPGRLVMVWQSFRKNPGHMRTTSANYADWKRQNEVFEDLAALRFYLPLTLTATDHSEQIEGQQVTANFFPVLGVRPLLGRNFTPEEQTGESGRVVLISYEFWQRHFSGEPEVIGKTLQLDGASHTIIGVMPPAMRLFRLPGLMSYDPSVWRPLGRFDAATHQPGEPYWLHAIGRLKPGVNLDQAQSSMTVLAGRLAREYPRFNKDMEIPLEPLHDALIGESRTPLLVLMGAVGFVLLIANANVAGLLLARATARGHEFAVRSALGGARHRLVRQLLTESGLLSIVGGLAGFLLAIVAVPVLVRLAPAESIPATEKIGVDFAVLGFTVAASVLTGMVFGLAPAWHSTGLGLVDVFKANGRTSSAGLPAQRTRDILVAAEIAIASVLLVGAGLLIQTLGRLEAVDPGFKTENVIAMQVQLPPFKYAKPTGKKFGKSGLNEIAVSPELPIRVSQILNKLESAPGVQRAAVASYLPLIVGQGGRGFEVEGHTPAPGEGSPGAGFTAVSPNYFKAMGIPLLNGRAFSEGDAENSEWVAIVSKSTALRYWPGESPIGKRVIVRLFGGTEPPRTIVGIAGDVRSQKLDEEPGRMLYVPYAQQPPVYPHTNYRERHFPNFVIRAGMNAAAMAAVGRRAVAETDSNLPISDLRTLRQIVSMQTASRRFYMTLLSAFAVIALVLAAVGIYGVMRYSVVRRTHEIGIRIALGAGHRDILRMMLKRGAWLAAAGLTAGLAASFYLTRFIGTLLWGVRATDPATLAAVSFVLVMIVGLACYLPARRATQLDPVAALRHD